MTKTEREVLRIAKAEATEDDITLDTQVEGMTDSLGLTQIVMDMEDAFGVVISDEQADEFLSGTLSDVVGWINENTK